MNAFIWSDSVVAAIPSWMSPPGSYPPSPALAVPHCWLCQAGPSVAQRVGLSQAPALQVCVDLRYHRIGHRHFPLFLVFANHS